MKTSFYFVAWLCAYTLINFSGIALLQENSIIVALLFVWLIAGFLNSRFAKEIGHISSKQNIALFETIYTNNIKKYRKDCLARLIIDGASFTYFALVIIGFLLLNIGSIVEYIIFVLIFLLITHSTYKQLKQYLMVINATEFTPELISKILNEQGMAVYESYSSQRPYHEPEDFVTHKKQSLTTFKVVTIAAAIGSILIGIWFIWQWLLYTIFAKDIDFLVISLIMYGSIAIYFGVRDLVDSVRNFRS